MIIGKLGHCLVLSTITDFIVILTLMATSTSWNVRFIMTNYEKDKAFLSIVETNVYNIPERLKEYDKRFFVVRNHKKQTYEVHYEDNKTSSYCFTVPYKELDTRTIYFLQENDVSRLGEDVFSPVYDSDKRMEKNKEKNWKKYIDKVARESHHLFREAYWGKSQF